MGCDSAAASADNTAGLFPLFSNLRTCGYAHKITHYHNNYFYNSQAQPFGLDLLHAVMRT